MKGDLTEYAVERPDFDTKFLRSAEPGDLSKSFDNFKDVAILKAVLEVWGQSPTSEILDHVYFRTEPMEHGIRNENLDFSRVLQQLPETYRKPSSNKTAGEIKALR
jgi:hypothetical protein